MGMMFYEGGAAIGAEQYEVSELSAAVPDHFPELLRQDFLRTAEAKRAERIRAWLLLERTLASGYGIESLARLDLRRTPKGKPYSRAFPELHFNISHCRMGCACIIADRGVGIDIERRFAWREPLAKKICHTREWEHLQRLDEKEKERMLRLLWSAKESIVKMTGDGLGYGLDRLDLSGLSGEIGSGQGPREDRDPPEGRALRGPLCAAKVPLDGQGTARLALWELDRCTMAACIAERRYVPGLKGSEQQQNGGSL